MFQKNLAFRKIRALVWFMKIKNIDTLFWSRYEISDETKSEIKSLCGMNINDLRSKYYEVYGYHSGARNKDFLIRKIAWKLQSIESETDIKSATREKAYSIVDFSRLRLNKLKPNSKTQTTDEDTVKRKIKFSRDPRLPKSGAILCKTFAGEQHVVKVLDSGFEYKNEQYKTLSSVDRKIAGTNWNGFKFFNL